MEYIVRLCGYDGVSQLVSELAYYYGVKREILFPATHPNHREMVSDDMTSKQAIIQAASNLGRTVPVFSCFWLQQRSFVLVSKVNVIYAFGILHRNDREAKRNIGWTIQMALDQGKEVFLFDDFSQRWYTWQTMYEADPISQFVPCAVPPRLQPNSAVIGEWFISDESRDEIKNLFLRTFQTLQELCKKFEDCKM